MKKILIPVSNSFTVRNFLRSDFLSVLLRGADHSVVLLAPKDKIDYYRQEFSLPGVQFELLPPVTESAAERLFKLLESSSIHTNTVKLIHWHYLKRKGTQTPFVVRLPVFIFRRACSFLGQFRFFRHMVRLLYGLISCQPFSAVLDTYKPDVVFCPTLIYGGEFALLKEAKLKGILTCGMVSSWDNFYSKTYLRVFPDRLLVQTRSLFDQAVARADFPPEKIQIVGVPQYDRHFRRTGVLPRDEFIRSLGGDPEKKLILYALSGKVGFDIDANMLTILDESMKKKVFGADVQVLVRPYPKSDFREERNQKVRTQYGFLVRASSRSVGSGKDAWEFDEAALDLLMNSLAHADVIISTYSTFFIEACIFDRPTVAVAFDRNQTYDYWNSAKRFFDWDHLDDIKKHHGIWLARSEKDFITAVETFLQKPDTLQSGRKAIVAEQCYFTDGRSAERVAEALKTFRVYTS